MKINYAIHFNIRRKEALERIRRAAVPEHATRVSVIMAPRPVVEPQTTFYAPPKKPTAPIQARVARMAMAGEKIPVKMILALTEEISGIARNEIISIRRNASVVRARHFAMWLMRRLTSKSLPSIGGILGRRDHTTIIHGIRRIEAEIAAGTLPASWARVVEIIEADRLHELADIGADDAQEPVVDACVCDGVVESEGVADAR